MKTQHLHDGRVDQRIAEGQRYRTQGGRNNLERAMQDPRPRPQNKRALSGKR